MKVLISLLRKMEKAVKTLIFFYFLIKLFLNGLLIITLKVSVNISKKKKKKKPMREQTRIIKV